MNRLICATIAAIFSVNIMVSFALTEDSSILIKEDFNNLDNWKPLIFPKIERHSAYSIESSGAKSYLVLKSSNSASALIFSNHFDPYQYPKVKWRWKIDNVYEKGDAKTKDGDDYPVRVYIIFKYDSSKAGFLDKVMYKSAKLLYGEYPPHSSLNYIWANREYPETVLESAYTGKSKMILLEKGRAKTGEWIEEEIDIITDYRKAFGDDPPSEASIAVMNDSDNTHESSISLIDYLIISK